MPMEKQSEYRGYFLSEDRGLWAIYMTGENQPIQTAIRSREQAEAWIDARWDASRATSPAGAE